MKKLNLTINIFQLDIINMASVMNLQQKYSLMIKTSINFSDKILK